MRNRTSWSRFEAQKRLASVDLTRQTLPWTTEPLVLISSSWGIGGIGGGEWCWLFSAATAVGDGNGGDCDGYGDYEDHVCDDGRLFQRFSPGTGPRRDHLMLRKMLLTCSC